MAFKRALSLSLGWSGLSAFVAVACATIPDFVVAPAAGDASAFADAARVLDGGARDADASAPRPDPPDCGPKLRIFATQDEYPANFGLINLDAYNTGAIICANVAARMNLGG